MKKTKRNLEILAVSKHGLYGRFNRSVSAANSMLSELGIQVIL